MREEEVLKFFSVLFIYLLIIKFKQFKKQIPEFLVAFWN